MLKKMILSITLVIGFSCSVVFASDQNVCEVYLTKTEKLAALVKKVSKVPSIFLPGSIPGPKFVGLMYLTNKLLEKASPALSDQLIPLIALQANEAVSKAIQSNEKMSESKKKKINFILSVYNTVAIRLTPHILNGSITGREAALTIAFQAIWASYVEFGKKINPFSKYRFPGQETRDILVADTKIDFFKQELERIEKEKNELKENHDLNEISEQLDILDVEKFETEEKYAFEKSLWIQKTKKSFFAPAALKRVEKEMEELQLKISELHEKHIQNEDFLNKYGSKKFPETLVEVELIKNEKSFLEKRFALLAEKQLKMKEEWIQNSSTSEMLEQLDNRLIELNVEQSEIKAEYNSKIQLLESKMKNFKADGDDLGVRECREWLKRAKEEREIKLHALRKAALEIRGNQFWVKFLRKGLEDGEKIPLSRLQLFKRIETTSQIGIGAFFLINFLSLNYLLLGDDSHKGFLENLWDYLNLSNLGNALDQDLFNPASEFFKNSIRELINDFHAPKLRVKN